MNRIERREFLALSGAVLCGVATMRTATGQAAKASAVPWIGYSQLKTNLPGGRHANAATTRARLVRADGTEARAIAEELASTPDSWTQFAGWAPDGRKAIISSGWEDPANATWEEEHCGFRFTEGWKNDMYLVDVESGAIENLTAVDRVSAYNTGLSYVAGTPGRWAFTAMIGDVSHPFTMDLDGHNKRDITSGKEGFTYGFSPSPNGESVAYHKDYQVYIARADGSEAKKVETGNAFNFAPQWAPNGEWVMFVSGERENCDPYVVRKDGTELRRVADRRDYKGWVAVYDVFDFHEGSSDVPIWATDSQGIYYTALVGDTVELMYASLAGETRQLTRSAPGVLQYHPKLSTDGHQLAFGSTRDGARQLYVRPADPNTPEAKDVPITPLAPGNAAMWAWWQPT